jgi:protoheme IX farnesyltransferase
MNLLRLYMQLTKARLSSLVLLTTAVGYVLGADSLALAIDWVALSGTLIGCAFAAGSANALNQIVEIARDGRMLRTRQRPLPSGALSTRHALVVAVGLGVAGIVVLRTLANDLAAALALVTILIYVVLYTPMKVRSSLNTLVGAVCGAIPPMIGWVGATGSVGAGAWVLAGLLFIWQIPHFLALAWLYREDYARGHFAMLPVFDPRGRITCQIVVLTSLMLVPVTLVATLVGLGGWVFTFGSLALGGWMLYLGVRMYFDRSDDRARRVFLASIVYLSAVLVLLVVDRGSVNVPIQVAAAPMDLPATALIER